MPWLENKNLEINWKKRMLTLRCNELRKEKDKPGTPKYTETFGRKTNGTHRNTGYITW
jgi:hypothetical protein